MLTGHALVGPVKSGRWHLGVLAARGPAPARPGGAARCLVPEWGPLCLGGACGQTGPARPRGARSRGVGVWPPLRVGAAGGRREHFHLER